MNDHKVDLGMKRLIVANSKIGDLLVVWNYYESSFPVSNYPQIASPQNEPDNLFSIS
jgi:hypothetical protein